MAVAARLLQGTSPAFGVRALALMTGLDHTTVAKHLKRLREEPDPLVERIVIGRGKAGDRYLLIVPDAYRAEAVARQWRGGRIDATHPGLHHLGACVALVHEVLSSAPTGAAEIARLALLSSSATTEALRTLAALGRAERTPDGWVRGGRPLDDVAAETGADAEHAERLAAHRAERKLWHEVLASWEMPAAARAARAAQHASRDPDRRPRPTESSPAPDDLSGGATARSDHVPAAQDLVPWPTEPPEEVPLSDMVPPADAGRPPPEIEALALLEHVLGAKVIGPVWRYSAGSGRSRVKRRRRNRPK
ncbi:hypothetical protein [Nonomuraea sp. NPDC046570]|uniref:hypothetical protein n=1 Tax=Nonomuraea sp. NPDC046570 TaxID=3155255 RepID=UPI0033FFCA88